MKTTSALGAAIITSTLLFSLSGCQKDGPAEQAGESIDEATESLREDLEDAGDAIQDAAEGKN